MMKATANRPARVRTFSQMAERERVNDAYWSQHDPISDLRCWWRAQTIRNTFHILPGETILELGCGSGTLTRPLVRATRGECPITAASFAFDLGEGFPESLGLNVETLRLCDFPDTLEGRAFDYVVATNILDTENAHNILSTVKV